MLRLRLKILLYSCASYRGLFKCQCFTGNKIYDIYITNSLGGERD